MILENLCCSRGFDILEKKFLFTTVHSGKTGITTSRSGNFDSGTGTNSGTAITTSRSGNLDSGTAITTSRSVGMGRTYVRGRLRFVR